MTHPKLNALNYMLQNATDTTIERAIPAFVNQLNTGSDPFDQFEYAAVLMEYNRRFVR